MANGEHACEFEDLFGFAELVGEFKKADSISCESTNKKSSKSEQEIISELTKGQLTEEVYIPGRRDVNEIIVPMFDKFGVKRDKTLARQKVEDDGDDFIPMNILNETSERESPNFVEQRKDNIDADTKEKCVKVEKHKLNRKRLKENAIVQEGTVDIFKKQKHVMKLNRKQGQFYKKQKVMSGESLAGSKGAAEKEFSGSSITECNDGFNINSKGEEMDDEVKIDNCNNSHNENSCESSADLKDKITRVSATEGWKQHSEAESKRNESNLKFKHKQHMSSSNVALEHSFVKNTNSQKSQSPENTILNLKQILDQEHKIGEMVHNVDINVRKSGLLKSVKYTSRHKGDNGLCADTYTKLVSLKTSTPIDSKLLALEKNEHNFESFNNDITKEGRYTNKSCTTFCKSEVLDSHPKISEHHENAFENLLHFSQLHSATKFTNELKMDLKNELKTELASVKSHSTNCSKVNVKNDGSCISDNDVNSQYSELVRSHCSGLTVPFCNTVNKNCYFDTGNVHGAAASGMVSNCSVCSNVDMLSKKMVIDSSTGVPLCCSDLNLYLCANCDKNVKQVMSEELASKIDSFVFGKNSASEIFKNPDVLHASVQIHEKLAGFLGNETNTYDNFKEHAGHVHAVGKSVHKKPYRVSERKRHSISDVKVNSDLLSSEQSPEGHNNPLKILENLRRQLFEKAGASITQADQKLKHFESRLISSELKKDITQDSLKAGSEFCARFCNVLGCGSALSDIRQRSVCSDRGKRSALSDIGQSRACSDTGKSNVCSDYYSQGSVMSTLRCSEPQSDLNHEILKEFATSLDSIEKTKKSRLRPKKQKKKRFEKKTFLLQSMDKIDTKCMNSNDVNTFFGINKANGRVKETSQNEIKFQRGNISKTKNFERYHNQNSVSKTKELKSKTCGSVVEQCNMDYRNKQRNLKVISCQACGGLFQTKELLHQHYPCRVRQTRTWLQNQLRLNCAGKRTETKQFVCQLPKLGKQEAFKQRPHLLAYKKTKFRRVKGKRRCKLYRVLRDLQQRRKPMVWPHLNILFEDLSFKEKYFYRLGLLRINNVSEGLHVYNDEEIAMFEHQRAREKLGNVSNSNISVDSEHFTEFSLGTNSQELDFLSAAKKSSALSRSSMCFDGNRYNDRKAVKKSISSILEDDVKAITSEQGITRIKSQSPKQTEAFDVHKVNAALGEIECNAGDGETKLLDHSNVESVMKVYYETPASSTNINKSCLDYDVVDDVIRNPIQAPNETNTCDTFFSETDQVHVLKNTDMDKGQNDKLSGKYNVENATEVEVPIKLLKDITDITTDLLASITEDVASDKQLNGIFAAQHVSGNECAEHIVDSSICQSLEPSVNKKCSAINEQLAEETNATKYEGVTLQEVESALRYVKQISWKRKEKPSKQKSLSQVESLENFGNESIDVQPSLKYADACNTEIELNEKITQSPSFKAKFLLSDDDFCMQILEAVRIIESIAKDQCNHFKGLERISENDFQSNSKALSDGASQTCLKHDEFLYGQTLHEKSNCKDMRFVLMEDRLENAFEEAPFETDVTCKIYERQCSSKHPELEVLVNTKTNNEHIWNEDGQNLENVNHKNTEDLLSEQYTVLSEDDKMSVKMSDRNRKDLQSLQLTVPGEDDKVFIHTSDKNTDLPSEQIAVLSEDDKMSVNISDKNRDLPEWLTVPDEDAKKLLNIGERDNKELEHFTILEQNGCKESQYSALKGQAICGAMVYRKNQAFDTNVGRQHVEFSEFQSDINVMLNTGITNNRIPVIETNSNSQDIIAQDARQINVATTISFYCPGEVSLLARVGQSCHCSPLDDVELAVNHAETVDISMCSEIANGATKEYASCLKMETNESTESDKTIKQMEKVKIDDKCNSTNCSRWPLCNLDKNVFDDIHNNAHRSRINILHDLSECRVEINEDIQDMSKSELNRYGKIKESENDFKIKYEMNGLVVQENVLTDEKNVIKNCSAFNNYSKVKNTCETNEAELTTSVLEIDADLNVAESNNTGTDTNIVDSECNNDHSILHYSFFHCPDKIESLNNKLEHANIVMDNCKTSSSKSIDVHINTLQLMPEPGENYISKQFEHWHQCDFGKNKLKKIDNIMPHMEEILNTNRKSPSYDTSIEAVEDMRKADDEFDNNYYLKSDIEMSDTMIEDLPNLQCDACDINTSNSPMVKLLEITAMPLNSEISLPQIASLPIAASSVASTLIVSPSFASPPILEKVEVDFKCADFLDEATNQETKFLCGNGPPSLEPVSVQSVYNEKQILLYQTNDTSANNFVSNKQKSERHFLDVLGLPRRQEDIELKNCAQSSENSDTVKLFSEGFFIATKSNETNHVHNIGEPFGRHFSDCMSSSFLDINNQSSQLPCPGDESDSDEITLAKLKEMLSPAARKTLSVSKESLMKIKSGIDKLSTIVKTPTKNDPSWLKKNALKTYSNTHQHADVKRELFDPLGNTDDFQDELIDDGVLEECVESGNNKMCLSANLVSEELNSKCSKGSIADNILQMLTTLEDKGNIADNMSNLLAILAENLGFLGNNIKTDDEHMLGSDSNGSDSDSNQSDYQQYLVSMENHFRHKLTKTQFSFEDFDEPPSLDDIPCAVDYSNSPEKNPWNMTEFSHTKGRNNNNNGHLI